MISFDESKPMALLFPMAPNIKALEIWIIQEIGELRFQQKNADFELYRYCKCVVDSIFEDQSTDAYYWPAVHILSKHFLINEERANLITNSFMVSLSNSIEVHLPARFISPKTCITIGEGFIMSAMTLP